jgi:hypothetical protein
MPDNPTIKIPAGAQPSDLWREVTEIIQGKSGCSRDVALNHVITEWLLNGDASPLIASSAELDNLILSVIVLMLLRDPDLDYHLEIVQNHIGRPKNAGSRWRDVMMALTYLQRRDAIGSDAAFEEIAAHFNVSVSTVRNALGNYRKLGKPKPPSP